MTPISMMPPVDYCPSCEGRKDESKAREIGETRAEQAEFRAEADPSETPAPGAAPPAAETLGAAGEERQTTVATAVQPLLAPDLAVQASFARPFNEAAGSETEALRLRAAEAYRTP